MAITLDATPGGPAANTYVLVPQVDAFAESVFDVDAAAWAAIQDDERKFALLVRAARLLDTRVTWIGERSTTTQAMAWPRLFVRRPGGGAYEGNTYSSVEIPRAVQEAQMVLATWLSGRSASGEDPFGLSGTSNLQALSVGPISLTFRNASSVDGANFFDEAIVPILEAGGCIRPNSRLTR